MWLSSHSYTHTHITWLMPSSAYSTLKYIYFVDAYKREMKCINAIRLQWQIAFLVSLH